MQEVRLFTDSPLPFPSISAYLPPLLHVHTLTHMLGPFTLQGNDEPLLKAAAVGDTQKDEVDARALRPR
jgi:hypothetical protein